MSGTWGSVSRQRLMETIVILWTLTEVPELANVQGLSRMPSGDQLTRQLTFEREKGLVEILAFLSGTNDDSSKVMAVCIEENLLGDSLTIRLATNSGDCSDVVSGMKRIASVLEQSSRRTQPKDVDSHKLLREITRLDFWKILYRLRSRFAKQSIKIKKKPVLVAQITTAVEIASREKIQTISAERVAMLKRRIQEMHKSFAALEALLAVDADSEVAQDILMRILVDASLVAEAEMLPSVLKIAYPLDDDLRNHVLSGLGKLARYCSASKDLVSAARTRRYSIFDKVNVEQYRVVQPPHPPLSRKHPTLQSSINDLIKTEPTLKNHVYSFSVKQYLGKSYTSKSRDFEIRTSNSPASFKVHAEIQLLFFYELHSVDLPPRVICASKSPCYLCHLFFTIHGQFHVPETHGRLYTGWILPTWLDKTSDERQQHISQIIDSLHATLVQRIQHIVMQRRMPFKYPNESVLWTAADWSASSLQSQPGEDTSEISIHPQQASQKLDACAGDSNAYHISDKRQGSSSSSSSQDKFSLSASAGVQHLHQSLASQVNHPATTTHFHRLTDTLQSCLADTKSAVHIKTEHLNLTISRDLSYYSVIPETCWISCRLSDKLGPSRSVLDIQPVDVMSMPPGSEIILSEGSPFSDTELLLVACGQILSIKYSCSRFPDTKGDE